MCSGLLTRCVLYFIIIKIILIHHRIHHQNHHHGNHYNEQVHHSSEDYNLTTALRQSAFQGFGSWVQVVVIILLIIILLIIVIIVIVIISHIISTKGAISIAPPGDFQPNPIPSHFIAFGATSVSDGIF